MSSVTEERVQPYVIRTEKRRAIDAEGKPLFKPSAHGAGAGLLERTATGINGCLYEAVTEYVREGYNQAMREKRSTIGFLMILMQRLVVVQHPRDPHHPRAPPRGSGSEGAQALLTTRP
ncbi:MAG: hypothetical protein KatS3mg082_2812 [Nitrospiraceae bacterium]|nr:MAG: hypothetical protein KatS3mg082_2812 [Nitrospiraceae bacterium]